MTLFEVGEKVSHISGGTTFGIVKEIKIENSLVFYQVMWHNNTQGDWYGPTGKKMEGKPRTLYPSTRLVKIAKPKTSLDLVLDKIKYLDERFKNRKVFQPA